LLLASDGSVRARRVADQLKINLDLDFDIASIELTTMALAASLANWDAPSTSSFAAWRAQEVTNVSCGAELVGETDMTGRLVTSQNSVSEGYRHVKDITVW